MTFELWGHKHVSNPQIEEAHISDHPDLIPEVVRLLREMQKAAAYPRIGHYLSRLDYAMSSTARR